MPLRILIIDTSDAHRNVVVNFLHKFWPESEVHQFDPSRSGRPHAEFDWAGYQLIIMDSRLGAENGLQWFEQYRQSEEDFPPVMFLSSENRVDVAVKAMKLGARDFLTKKGIKPQQLKQTIEAILPKEEMYQDMLPDLKPLPGQESTMQYSGADTQIIQDSTMQYSGADTQILPGGSGIQASDEGQVEEADEADSEYWEEQTQILAKPAGWLDKK
jgi:DNA-binding NtrC family response regulator